MRVLMEAMEGNAFPPLTPERLAELNAAGFDTRRKLYHGTNARFDSFDKAFLRTANHIYLTPDPRSASMYGNTVYICFGRTEPMADLADTESLKTLNLLNRLAELFADDFEDKAEAQLDDDADEAEIREKAKELFIEVVTSGDERLYGFDGRFQDSLVQQCFDWGYKCVRMFDPNSIGAPISYVFDNPDDLVIVGVLNDPRDVPPQDLLRYLD